MISSIRQAWNALGGDSSIDMLTDILYQLNAFSGFFTILSLLPQIAIAVGLCMTIYSTFTRGSNRPSSAGLKVVKIVCAISFISSVVSLVLCILGELIWIGVQAASDEPQAAWTLIIILYAIVLAIVAFVVFYRKKILDTVNSGINIIEDNAQVRPSRFVAVMCFITCGCNIITAFTGGISEWLSAVANLCFGLLIYRFIPIVLSSYKSRLLFKEENADDTVTIPSEPSTSEHTSSPKPKRNTLIALGAVVVVVIGVIIWAFSSAAPGVDKQLVGTWEYENNDESQLIFKRNGSCTSNPGTGYEEIGTYTANGETLTIVSDGEINEFEYRLVDDDVLQIKRTHYTSSWETYTSWDKFYRVG